MITIVIPCFNEAHRLSSTPFVSFLDDSSDLFFVFVDDGSTDHTAESLDRISLETGSKSTVLTLSENQGKAEAVRQGILWSLEKEGSHVGYWDGDLATPLSEIPTFIDHSADLTSTGKHVRTGKKIKPLAPSVNPKRLTDTKKIEKWFKRNCKWTLGRECTPQEKGNVLAFIKSK